MPEVSPLIRLFISSTFADFAFEREVLQRAVFPRLRTLCAAQGCRFQPIDLRWGVSEEAGNERRTLAICLDEVARCQRLSPDLNFFILLGDRYGSCFLPESIPSDQVARLLPHLTSAEQAAFSRAYKEDLNALRPEFVLLSSDGSAATKQREESLRQALIQAAHSADFSDEELLSFVASATYQEIQRGLLNADCDPSATICAIRTLDVPPAEQQPQLAALKLAVVQRLGNERVWRYNAQSEFTGLQAVEAAHKRDLAPSMPIDPQLREASTQFSVLAEQFYALLEPRIQQALARRQATKSASDLTDAANNQFAQARTSVVIGRDGELKKIAEYLSMPLRFPLIVTGAAGVGKSTLLAQAVKEAGHTYPQAVIVTRFIGVTPETSNLAALLTGLQHEIAKRYGLPSPAQATSVDKLVIAVRQQLFSAEIPPERPLFLFIDALDQLGADKQRVDWLPYHLAPNVHVVLSLLADRLELIDLRQRVPDGLGIQLESLTRAEGQQLLRAWLAAEQRRITPEQEAAILGGFASEPEERGRPIYLRLALEQARAWRSFEDEYTSPLPPSVPALIQAYFAWLENSARHGRALMAYALGSLAASRHGLAEDELLDVLSRSAAVRTELHDLNPIAPSIDPQQPLPVILWAQLASHLESYLTERAADGARLWTFYHRQIREEVEKGYLSGDERTTRHADLANYFDAQLYRLSANGLTSQTAGTIASETWNRRKLAEIAYQQVGAEAHTLLESTLTDARFLEGKLTEEGVTATLDDLALTSENADITKMSAAIRMGATVLTNEPSEVLNQIAGRIGQLAQLHHLPDPNIARLQLRSQSLTPPDLALLRILQSDEGVGLRCALSADGRLALSASTNGTLQLWDTVKGESLRTWQVPALSMYPARAYENIPCALSHDGQIALSTSRLALHVWDTNIGQEVGTLEGHTKTVWDCALSADGRLALSVSADNTLRLWDVATGQSRILPPLRGTAIWLESIWAKCCALSADGRLVLAASLNAVENSLEYSQKLSVWDTSTGQLLRELEGYTDDVSGCALSADGRLALAPVGDQLRLWDTTSGKLLRTFKNDSGTVTCALSADGQLALAASNERTLRLWDTTSGQIVNVFEGHTSKPTKFALSANGQFVLSISGNSMWLWDATDRQATHQLKRPSLPHGRCALSADGCLALSATEDSNKLVLWDTTSWQTQRVFKGDKANICALDADGHVALSVSSVVETVQFWDITNGAVLHTKGAFQGYLFVKNDCALSADGSRALIAPWGRRLRFLDTVSGRTLRFLSGHKDLVWSCALSADGRLALSASDDHTLRLWDTAKGRTLHILDGLDDPVHGCALSADGRLAVSFCKRFRGEVKQLQVWDTMRGQALHVLEGHSSEVTDCALSGDGCLALSSSRDKTVRLWDTSSGKEIARWTHEVPVNHCTLSANGQVIVASDANDGVHVFDVMGVIPNANAPSPRATVSWLAEREPQKPGLFRRVNR